MRALAICFCERSDSWTAICSFLTCKQDAEGSTFAFFVMSLFCCHFLSRPPSYCALCGGLRCPQREYSPASPASQHPQQPLQELEPSCSSHVCCYSSSTRLVLSLESPSRVFLHPIPSRSSSDIFSQQPAHIKNLSQVYGCR